MVVINSTCLSSFFFFTPYPNSSWTTIFFYHLRFLSFWRNIWERVKWFSALFKWSSREKGDIILSLCESYASRWWLMPVSQMVVFQLLLEQLITKTNERMWVGFHGTVCEAPETCSTWCFCVIGSFLSFFCLCSFVNIIWQQVGLLGYLCKLVLLFNIHTVWGSHSWAERRLLFQSLGIFFLLTSSYWLCLQVLHNWHEVWLLETTAI